MANQSAAQVVHQFLSAVQQGDFETVGLLLHPEITWQQPGQHPFAGTQASAGAVFNMVGGMFQHTGNNMRLTDIKSITTHGNQVAALLHWSAARPGGETLEVDNIDVYTVTAGKITAATVFTADEAAENAFWN